MVLERHPKKFKHLIRTMLTQLVLYENIMTTRAKAKHLRPFAQKLFLFAKKAEAGETSALNLLKGRIHTKKAQKKLLVDLMPRLKHLNSNFICMRPTHIRRRGDNAPMSQIFVKGNQKTQYENKKNQQMMENNPIYDNKGMKTRVLLEQKQFYMKKIQENPGQEQFFKNLISRLEFKQQLLGKSRKQPPKYNLLI